MQVHDLSVPILDGVDWYREADCPPVSLQRVGGLDECGWVSHQVSLMVLNGTTYAETAAHLYSDAPTLDQLPPEKLILRAHVVALRPESQRLPAPAADLADFTPGTDALLIHSGWDAHLREPRYYSASPYFSEELQRWIFAHRPAILGGDMLSFDHPQDAAMPFLRGYFRSGGVIVCPLIGLGPLVGREVTLCVAPLRLQGASAAPCRVFAW
jgi:kynurenine formamidase